MGRGSILSWFFKNRIYKTTLPLDHTLRHPYKFLILAIFFRSKKNFPTNLGYKKFYYINETKWASLSRRPA